MPNPNSKNFKILTAALLAFGLLLIWISVNLPGGSENPGIPAPQAGFQAPDFTLTTTEGEEITLSKLRGKAVIVNIWASWCGPCRAEMPDLEDVYQEYKNKNFVLLAVNATNQDSAAAAISFADELGLTFPILLDPDGTVGRLYQVSALPSTFFIRPDGTIEEIVIGGPMAEALLLTRVETLLQEVE